MFTYPRSILGVFAFLLISTSIASSQSITSIEDYNNSLPLWGTSWAPGNKAVNGYYPSFYTGFAMRSEFPERIHVRLGRGNQTRVSVILDEKTVSDYLFDLTKRYEFYKKVTGLDGSKAILNIDPRDKSHFLNQLSYFSQIIESSKYGILDFAKLAQKKSAEEIYQKGLSLLSELNPGRVFQLHLNLNAEFTKWKSYVQYSYAGKTDLLNFFTTDKKQAVIALNTLVWGRINYTEIPSADLLQKLSDAVNAALTDDANFNATAFDLFKAAIGTKYDIKVLNAKGQWENSIQCSNVNSCYLNYPEFTTIYPTGSVIAPIQDQFGNKIAGFATPGLWKFVSTSKHNVDNIRSEPFYGWVPKMDYEGIGNGFHNPAVRFGGVNSSVKTTLDIPSEHNTLWSVKRGGVSHGCSRLPVGHVWEMRHILPVENEKMTQVHYFGNNALDFDLYDVDGNGETEVMGVEYMISYGLQGTEGLANREGADLEINKDKKLEFYNNLYGSKNVFEMDTNGNFVFTDPSISIQSHLDAGKKSVNARLTMNGRYKLYEQTYEKDKLQFYSLEGSSTEMSAPLKRMIRLMGRVRGCAPASNKAECGEAAFDKESQSVILEMQ